MPRYRTKWNNKRKYGASRGTRQTYRRAYSVSRKRYSKKRGSKMNARMSRSIPKSINLRQVGLPRTLITQFTYRDYMTFSENGEQRVYGLNCMFRPKPLEPGTSSHQPRWFDQLLTANLYQRYTVYKADVELVFRNANDDDAMMVIYVGPNSSLTGNISALFQSGENPYTYTRIVNGQNTGGPDHKVTFKGSFKMAKVFGIKKGDVYSDDIFFATYQSNPLNRLNMVLLGTQDAPGGIAEEEPGAPLATEESNIKVKCEVYIKYYAKLNFQAGNLPGSSGQ